LSGARWETVRRVIWATASVAVRSPIEAITVATPDYFRLTLQCDNVFQYASKKFRKATSILGVNRKFIWTHTPEQNGHIRVFHRTLKRKFI